MVARNPTGGLAQSQFFSAKDLKPAAVRRSTSAINPESGGVLKLKQAFPCMRFFSAGEIVPASVGFM